MDTPDGWYPDPTGRHQMRRWEGGRWVDWVSTNGQVGTDPMQAAPASGGGTLTTEPVIRAIRVANTWTLSTLHDLPLATIEVAGWWATMSDPAGVPTHQLRRSVAGTTTVISVRDRADRELGRYEEVHRASGGFRLVGLGALLATLDAQENDLRRLSLLDPGGHQLGRLTQENGRWTTELAHPLSSPLAELAALCAPAVALARH